jgi:hypothetical protein
MMNPGKSLSTGSDNSSFDITGREANALSKNFDLTATEMEIYAKAIDLIC